MNEQGRILLAEDDEIVTIIIRDLLDSHGFQVTTCTNGLAAWECLQTDRQAYDAVLLDLDMPLMDGMEVLRRIKNDSVLTHIPVIMETAQGDKESIREGLAQGAYYYLTKPFQPEVLLAVINAALQHGRAVRDMVARARRAERPLALLHSGCFRFRDLEEGTSLASYLAGTCPKPEQAIQGLQELLVNAVEHGNLAISYAGKGALIRDGSWQEEVQRRLHMAEYRDRYVEVDFQRRPESLRFTIRDQGAGFDWKDFLDLSPERAFDLNGRGIAIARKLSLDTIEFQGNGNTVIATINLTPVGSGPAPQKT